MRKGSPVIDHLIRPLIALAVGLLAALVVSSETPAQALPRLPIRLNVGSDEPYTDSNGNGYYPDQEWTPQTQAGYIGGHSVSAAFTVGGTPDTALYEKQRRGWQEYRFSSIPNGDYLVTLHFCQIAVLDDHGPLYTILNVAIEDQTVLDGLNVFAEVGGNYALIRRFAVTVADGDLNVLSTPVVGEPGLAAIEVQVRSPDAVAPAAPVDLTAMESYNEVLLDWADSPDSDLDGYHVYRAESPDGPYTRLTVEPIHVSRYQDIVTATHVTYAYRVSAVDVYGNESGMTSEQAAFALDASDATLPFYHLELSPESLLTLHTDPWTDNEVMGNFVVEGQPFRVEVRYRGNWGRYFCKKSWKIRFPDDSPFPGEDEVNLRSDFNDSSLMRSKLATELFEAGGIRPPQAEHVLLSLNGEYLGVYTRSEQVDERFAERTGRDPSVSIYKAAGNRHMDFSRQLSSTHEYHEAFEKKSNLDTDYADLVAWIELINNAPDETFAYEIQRVFDVAAYLDYHAIIVLTSNLDFSSHNQYLFHDLATGRWELIPYDFDNAFGPSGSGAKFAHDWPIDMGTPAYPIWGWVKNTLLTRVLDVPQYRAYYCHRLAEYMDTIFSDESAFALIDATHAAIREDGLRDWHKYGWESPDAFLAAPDDLKAYVTERKRVLLDQMPGYCPAEQPYLTINEIMAGNRATLEDPDEPGEYPAWFEIYNAGLEPVDLAGIALTHDLANPARFPVTGGITIPAGGFVTFFADGDPGQGPLHTSFQLDVGGGQIGILSGAHQIDSHTYGPQAAGVSEGHYPDGTDNWISFDDPTPGGSNLLFPPVVSGTTHSPVLPSSASAATVMTTITDDGAAPTATLYYSTTASGFVKVRMIRVLGDLYAARVPPQPSGSQVEYYVRAVDDDGQTATDPPNTDTPYRYIVDYRPPAVFINEILADNESVWQDPDEPGEFPDWIELYNPGPGTVDLGGRYLSDGLGNPTKFQIARGITIPAEGFLVFYADGDPQQGPLHTNFRLSKNGESVRLFDIDAADNQPLDARTFGPQAADRSLGRCPDGSDAWTPLAVPSPGAANGPCGTLPVISSVAHTPLFPTVSDSVAVTAKIGEGRAAITVTLWYSDGVGFVAVPMVSVGEGVYSATIPARNDDMLVTYYVQAEDRRGGVVTDPRGAPAAARSYRVGYRQPPLLINEFMAANDTFIEDPDEPGEFPDWIELYNAGPVPIHLGGKYITDDLADPTKFRIGDGVVVPAGGFILFYADGDPEQGLLHTNFGLSRNGESIGLFDVDATGNQPIDAHTFGPQVADTSERRWPNGGERWVTFRTPTPGEGDVAGRYLPVVLKRTMD